MQTSALTGPSAENLNSLSGIPCDAFTAPALRWLTLWNAWVLNGFLLHFPHASRVFMRSCTMSPLSCAIDSRLLVLALTEHERRPSMRVDRTHSKDQTALEARFFCCAAGPRSLSSRCTSPVAIPVRVPEARTQGVYHGHPPAAAQLETWPPRSTHDSVCPPLPCFPRMFQYASPCPPLHYPALSADHARPDVPTPPGVVGPSAHMKLHLHTHTPARI